MLQLAGTGVAMGNARDSVKACADFTTLSNNMDGVAVAIEKAILATIKPTEVPLDQLNARAKHALMGNLGIQYTYASEDRVEATMPVDERTRQPFGILHGGATLALAETVAGLGSMILAKPDEMVVGMQVSGRQPYVVRPRGRHGTCRRDDYPQRPFIPCVERRHIHLYRQTGFLGTGNQ